MAHASRFDGQKRWLHNVRLYPSCAQTLALFGALKRTHDLYNAMLEQAAIVGAAIAKSSTISIATSRSCARQMRRCAASREVQDATKHRLDLPYTAFIGASKRDKRRARRVLGALPF